MDGAGGVTHTGSLAELTAPLPPLPSPPLFPVHLALASIVLRPVFLAQPLIELALELRIWQRGGFYLPENKRPQTGEVAVCVTHCGTGLSNGGSLCIVQGFWRGICGLLKGIRAPLHGMANQFRALAGLSCDCPRTVRGRFSL